MLEKIIPSFLYNQYYDDLDLQGFVKAQNTLAQEYLDWFNAFPLPIYTTDTISGNLLDWVGEGLYGVKRPVLQEGIGGFIGAVNTFLLNQIPANGARLSNESTATFLNDDFYKRVITWCFFKGDGTQFTVKWLKKRVERFLFGVNGLNLETDQTYRVSITFGANNQVTIRIPQGLRTQLDGAIANTFTPNSFQADELNSTYVAYPPIPDAELLQVAIDQGILPLPFQYKFKVSYS
jgi:hypothetical protein